MALAGHATTVRIRTSSGAGSSADDLDGAQSVALNRMRDELETTDFKDGAYKTLMLGLASAEIPLSGDYESGDTPQGRLSTAHGDGTSVYAVILWDGSTGHNVECKVTNFNLKAGVGEKVTFEATLKSTGAVSTV